MAGKRSGENMELYNQMNSLVKDIEAITGDDGVEIVKQLDKDNYLCTVLSKDTMVKAKDQWDRLKTVRISDDDRIPSVPGSCQCKFADSLKTDASRYFAGTKDKKKDN